MAALYRIKVRAFQSGGPDFFSRGNSGFVIMHCD
nr:MAG TPA: hypothetical protein [Caudoviricetes sp.]